jgi:chromosome segregation ATPase
MSDSKPYTQNGCIKCLHLVCVCPVMEALDLNRLRNHAKALELQVEELKITLNALHGILKSHYDILKAERDAIKLEYNKGNEIIMQNVKEINQLESRVRELELELSAVQKDAYYWHAACAKLSNELDKK